MSTENNIDTATVTYTNLNTGETRSYDEMLTAGWYPITEESYGDRYQYPALYSMGIGGVRDVLDMSDGDRVLGWTVEITTDTTPIAVDDGDAAFSITETVDVNYYNTSTHEVKSLDQMISDGWFPLSESYGDAYQYPALYNYSTHSVVDMSAGSSGDGWIVYSSEDVLSITEDSPDPDGTGALSYSWQSSDDGITWSEIATSSSYTLTSAENGKSVRAVISYTDNDGFSETVTTNSTQIASVDDGDAAFSLMETVAATYYNTSTHEVRTFDQMLTAGWIALSEASYGDTYQYPAIYSNGQISDENGPIRQALDMSPGDQVGDWIVASSGDAITIKEESADPDGTGTLSYSWQSSDDGDTGWTEFYTASTYTITSSNEGKYIKAIMTYTDDEGFSETVSSGIFFKGTSGADSVGGGSLVDKLYGGDENDKLFGGGKDDLLDGGEGNDILYGGFGNDQLIGGAGIDTAVFSSRNNRINLSLTTAQQTVDGRDVFSSIENVNAGGGDDIVRGDSANNRLNGQAGADILIGNAGNDILNGGSGIDDLRGGAGDDRYFVDDAGDVIREGSNQGTDLVFSTATYAIRNSNIENLNLMGTADINASGNASANIIRGNRGANRLIGGADGDTLYGNNGNDKLFGNLGNDNLFGNAGNDHLIGGNGNDRLIGGIGNDTLNGGSGNDVFWINSGAGRAVIKDYSSGSDRIKLLGGLTEDDLSFSNVGGHTSIRDDDDDLLAIVQNTIADDITFI